MTTAQPLFYKKVVPLNKEIHNGLYIKPVENFKHTKSTNSLYIAAIEFPNASREYPIVFAQGQDNLVFPVVLLGLKKDQNMFVDKTGKWLASYIPAYVRRYPFILATTGENGGNYTVCIDENYPGFNSDKEGQKLFNEDGGETELLKQTVEFLKEYQNHVSITTLFCNKVNELGLLEPVQANIEKDGEKMSLGGFMCINRERLKALKPDQVSELVKTDLMELIYAHLHSLGNLSTLIKKLN